ncbi:MAG: PQQ-binding-like beta-propeller repeat protein, partial [Candidatus Helarchaeota archaeon]|nr:PQQ-binding-like beta-propeller repeat protein [Candidatus Helarchaeota archaeon]
MGICDHRRNFRTLVMILFVILIALLVFSLINLKKEFGCVSQERLSSSGFNDLTIDIRENFNSSVLDSKWNWQSDSQNISSWSLNANSGYLRITSPKVLTSWQWEITDVPYMYQTLPEGNWQIEIHVNEPTANEFANGIILYKDFNYWMIFANSVDSAGEMNLLRIKEGTVPDNMCGGGRGNNMPYLRLKKMGSLYYCFGSLDGNTWSDFGNCYTDTSYIRMGIWAQSHWSGTFSSDFDYFYFEELSEEPPPPDPNDKQPLWSYDTGNIVYAVEMTPDGQSIVAGTGNSVHLCDKDSSTPIWSFDTGDVVTAVDISDDGNYIVSAGGVLDHPGDVFLWQRDSSTPLWKFTGTGNFASIAISADGQYFAAGDRLANELHFWHKDSSVPLWSFNAVSGNWESVAISADGNYLVASDGFYHDYVYFFHTTSPVPLWSYECGSDVWSVDMTPDGRYITASSKDRRIYSWESSSSTPLWSYTTGHEAFSVSISNDGQYVAGGGRDKTIRLFDHFDSTPVWNYLLDSEIWAERAVSLSGNGEYIAVGTQNSKIYCFHRSNSNPLWNFSTITGRVAAVALSENGQYLVAGAKDHKVYLFENFDSQEPSQDDIPPEQVTGLTVTAESIGNCLTLVWNPSIAPDFWYYKIYRSTTCGFTPGPGNFLATSMTNTYLDIGLTDDITYYYRISALDEVPNEGTYSQEVSGVPGDSEPPAKVVGVSVAVVAAGNALNLTWTASAATDFVEYWVYRSEISGFIPSGATLIATPATNQYLDFVLVDDVTYYYRISAVDEVPNEGIRSDEKSGTPHDSEPPWKVMGLSISDPQIGDTLDLSWTTNSEPDVAGYRIYREIFSGFTPGSGNFIVETVEISYRDTGLTDGQPYYYRVRAIDEVPNEGSPSDELYGVPHDSMPPAKVRGFTQTIVSPDTISLSWTANTEPDLANYKVYRSTTSGFTPGAVYLIACPTTNYYLDSGLIEGQTYYYRITAVDEVPNEGTPSDEANGRPPPVDPPAKVTGVSISVVPEGNALSLSWTANTEPDLANYKVYRSMTPGFIPSLGNFVATSMTNTYLDTGLTDDLTYYYRISALDEVPNEGTPSDQASGTPHDSCAPEKVLGVSIAVIATGNQLNLTWTASTAADFVRYNVHRSTTSGFTPSGATLIASPATYQYLDSGLTDGIIYYYRISAVDEVPNEGSYCDEISACSIDIVAPNQVTGVTIAAVAVGNALTLCWDTSVASDLVEYRIYRSTTSGGPYSNIANSTPASYTDSGLIDGTTYYYVVSAVDEVPNEGFISQEVSGVPRDTTPPSKVTGVATSVNPDNSITLSWTASAATDFDHYNIYRSTTSGFVPGPINLIATSVTNSYTDNNRLERTNYYYRISALDEVPNEGTYSNEVGNYLPRPEPPQVTGVTVKVRPEGNGLDISWTDAGWYVVGYRVYRSTISGSTPGLANLVASVANNWYNDTGLCDGTTYYYRIVAYDEVPNFGTASSEVSGTPQDFVAPNKVIGLTVTNPTTGKQLDVSWTANTEADLAGYRIYRRNESGSYSLLTTVGSITSSYQDISVTDGVTYFYKVAAYDEVPNEGGNSSEVGGISTNVLPPARVTGLTIVSSSKTSLYLSWTPNTEPDLKWYNIYRSTSRGFTPEPANKIANATTPYYNDTGLIYLQKYYYRVSAEDIADLEGPFSSQKAGPGEIFLPKPVNVKVMVITTGNTLYLNWNNVSGADTYNIYRDIVPGFIPTPERFIKNVDTNETYDIGLTDNVTYYYRIAGVSPEYVEGHISDEVNNTPVDVDAPPQVTGLIVTNPGTGNRLTLSWNASTVADFNHYRIYRNGSLLTTRTTTTYTDTVLLDNLVYLYEISAVDDGGPVPNEGPNSTAVAGTPTDVTPPAQVTGVTITVIPTGNQLNITWTASTAVDFDHYKVYRNTTYEFTPTPANLVANTTINYYLDTNVIVRMTYYYRISAVDEAGNEGAASDTLGGYPIVSHTVSLIVWTSNQTTFVRTTITFGSGGFHVSSWGEIIRDGNNLWVNAEVWRLTGAAFTQAYWDISHNYEIEHLPSGNYNFLFKTWDNDIVSIDFLSKEIITVIPTGNAL